MIINMGMLKLKKITNMVVRKIVVLVIMLMNKIMEEWKLILKFKMDLSLILWERELIIFRVCLLRKLGGFMKI